MNCSKFVPENAKDIWKSAVSLAKAWGDIEDEIRASVSMIESFEEQLESVRKSAKEGRVLEGLKITEFDPEVEENDPVDYITEIDQGLIGKLMAEKDMAGDFTHNKSKFV